MKLYVQCCKSKKTGNLYRAMFCDFGYRKALITMDTTTICDFLDCAPSLLSDMKEGEVLQIGDIVRAK